MNYQIDDYLNRFIFKALNVDDETFGYTDSNSHFITLIAELNHLVYRHITFVHQHHIGTGNRSCFCRDGFRY